MDVQVKLGSALAGFRPAVSNTNTFSVSLPDTASAADLIASLGIPPTRALLVIINDELLPRDGYPDRLLAVGDHVKIMPGIHAG